MYRKAKVAYVQWLRPYLRSQLALYVDERKHWVTIVGIILDMWLFLFQPRMLGKILHNDTAKAIYFFISLQKVRVDQSSPELVSVHPVGKVRLDWTPVRTDHFPVADRDASSHVSSCDIARASLFTGHFTIAVFIELLSERCCVFQHLGQTTVCLINWKKLKQEAQWQLKDTVFRVTMVCDVRGNDGCVYPWGA